MPVRLDFMGRDSIGALVDGINKRLDKTEAKLKGVSVQSAKTEREAKRLWDQTRTPLERYNMTLAKARTALKGVEGGQETYRRVVARANRELERQTRIHRNTAGLRQFTTQLIGVSTAALTVTRALRAMQAQFDETVSRIRGAAQSRAELAQVSGALGGMASAEATSDRLRRNFGLTEDQTNTLLFAVGSAFSGQQAQQGANLFAMLQGTGVITGAEKLIPSVRGFRGAFPKLGVEQVTNMLFAAAQESPARAQTLGQVLGPAAQLGRAAGLSPAEIMAAGSVLASLAVEPAIGLTQFRGLAERLPETRFRAQSLAQVGQQLQGMDILEIRKLFPERRARGGAVALSIPENLENLRALTAAVEAAGVPGGGLARDVAVRAMKSDRLRREFALRVDEQQRRVSEEDALGPVSFQRRRVIEQTVQSAIAAADDPNEAAFASMMARAGGGLGRLLQLSPENTRRLAEFGATTLGLDAENLPNFQRQDDALEELRKMGNRLAIPAAEN